MKCPKHGDQVYRLSQFGCNVKNPKDIKYVFRTRQLAFSQAVYLDAIMFCLNSHVGSRGSSIVLDPQGLKIHEKLDKSWKVAPEDTSFRKKVLETLYLGEGKIQHRWIPCRPIPESDSWFETRMGPISKWRYI